MLSAYVQEGTVALVAAQVVLPVDLEGILHPELTEGGIGLTRTVRSGSTVKRLRHDNLPQATSSIGFPSLLADESGGSIEIQPSIVVEIGQTGSPGPTHRMYSHGNPYPVEFSPALSKIQLAPVH